MSKFAGFEKFLETNDQNDLLLHFSEIEEKIGQPLCDSAYRHAPYWYSRTNNIGGIIVKNGYAVEKVNLEQQSVCLKKKDRLFA